MKNKETLIKSLDKIGTKKYLIKDDCLCMITEWGAIYLDNITNNEIKDLLISYLPKAYQACEYTDAMQMYNQFLKDCNVMECEFDCYKSFNEIKVLRDLEITDNKHKAYKNCKCLTFKDDRYLYKIYLNSKTYKLMLDLFNLTKKTIIAININNAKRLFSVVVISNIERNFDSFIMAYYDLEVISINQD